MSHYAHNESNNTAHFVSNMTSLAKRSHSEYQLQTTVVTQRSIPESECRVNAELEYASAIPE